jgi:hypothetical protein
MRASTLKSLKKKESCAVIRMICELHVLGKMQVLVFCRHVRQATVTTRDHTAAGSVECG